MHMNEYTYEQIEIGTKESFEVSVTEEMLESFKKITGDINPLHNDAEYARLMKYEDRVVYGMLTASFLSTLAGVYLPGKRSLIMETNIKYTKPVYCGDIISVEGTVTDKNDMFRFIILKVVMKNHRGDKVLRAEMKVRVMDE